MSKINQFVAMIAAHLRFRQIVVIWIIVKVLLIALLLLQGLLLTSCLKENLSGCPEDIRVYFDITPREGGDAIDPANVDRMNLYVFDHSGYFLNEYADRQISNFNPDDYYMDCSDLLPGKYRFIAWGGMDTQFFNTSPVQFENGKTTFDEALLMLGHSGGIVSTRVHHLFHSDLPVTVDNSKTQRFTMPLAQQSNTITVRIIGLPENVLTYAEITDNNCTYRFDGSFASCAHRNLKSHEDDFKYILPCTAFGERQLLATINVMRLAKGRQPQLKIYDETGKTHFPANNQSGNLIELICSAIPDIDFDETHHYDIELRFNEIDLSATILINGWEVKDESYQLSE